MGSPQQALLTGSGGSGSDPNVGITVTWNPSDKATQFTLSNGDKSASHSGVGTLGLVRANTSRSTGKWYLEYFIEPTNNGNLTSARGRPGVGINTSATSVNPSQIIGLNDNYGFANVYDGIVQGLTSGFSGGVSMATSDVIGMAVDFDALKIWFARNNTFNGNPAAGTGYPVNASGSPHSLMEGYPASYFPAMCSAFGGFVTARFKTADFTYSPPSGFTSWET